MKRLAGLLFVFVALVSAPLTAGSEAASGAPSVRYVDFEFTVTGATARRIVQALDDAEREGDAFVLIRLDTPGGDVRAMETIVKRILDAKVPVVVWVGPAGAKAASAGFFILLAADVAAMAPGTRTGASAVIFAVGENQPDDVLLKKANEDAAALIRTIAEHRGRNPERAVEAVREAKAFTDSDALEAGLIDLVARSREELLDKLDGRKIRRFDGTEVTLRTQGARLVSSEVSLRQKIFEFLATPAVAFFLLMLGLAGIYVELSHPGLIFPAVVGALCLVLFAFAAQVLPVSTVGVLLILLAMVMFILEIKVTSYGMLTVGGALSLIIGSLMLFQGPIPEMRVPWPVVVPTALVLTGLAVLVMRLAIRAQLDRVATGSEGMVGEVGVAEETLDPEGRVFLHGEHWNARSVGGVVAQGAKVRVVKVNDLELWVEPVVEERAVGG